MTFKFKVDTVYINNKGEQYAYRLITPNGVSVINKIECFKLFKTPNCICENAVLVKDNYIRGKNVKLKRVVKQPRLNLNGIYTNFKSVELPYKSNIETYNTKRYIHGVLKHRINTWLNTVAGYKSRYHAVALAGVRQIGKTVVMQQLYNELHGVLFIDGSVFRGNLQNVLSIVENTDIRYIFVDEICKLSEPNWAVLTTFIHNSHGSRFFIITGSVRENVMDAAARISSCNIIQMQSIMYVERLAWGYEVNFKDAIKYTSYDKFETWVKCGEVNNAVTSDYVLSLVTETMQSYVKQGSYIEFKSEFLFGNTQGTVELLFKYVILCQLIYIAGLSNTFVDVERINLAGINIVLKQDIDSMVKAVNQFKRQLSRDTIKAFCNIIESAGLVSRVFLYNEKDNERLRQLEAESGVSAYLFEYPQMLRYIINTEVDGTLLNTCIEYTILMKANHYYYNVGKYRTTDGQHEVDIIYTLDMFNFGDINVIEVKNNVAKNTKPSKYQGLGLNEIQEFVLTSSDTVYKDIKFVLATPFEQGTYDRQIKAFRMRNDIVVLLLELGYIEKSYEYDIHKSGCTKSLAELWNKYRVYL